MTLRTPFELSKSAFERPSNWPSNTPSNGIRTPFERGSRISPIPPMAPERRLEGGSAPLEAANSGIQKLGIPRSGKFSLPSPRLTSPYSTAKEDPTHLLSPPIFLTP
jgi:hypothetical protein